MVTRYKNAAIPKSNTFSNILESAVDVEDNENELSSLVLDAVRRAKLYYAGTLQKNIERLPNHGQCSFITLKGGLSNEEFLDKSSRYFYDSIPWTGLSNLCSLHICWIMEIRQKLELNPTYNIYPKFRLHWPLIPFNMRSYHSEES